MKQSILTLRSIFLIFCLIASCLVWYTQPQFQTGNTGWIFGGSLGLGLGLIFLDGFLKRMNGRIVFSSLFGLCLGAIVTSLLRSAPFFDTLGAEGQTAMAWGLFLFVTYFGMTLSFRSKDEFDFMIPFLRFSPMQNEGSRVVLDSSVLIDGRIATVCQSRFMSSVLIIPKFVIEELHQLADMEEPQKRSKGRKGIEVLNKLKNMNYIDLRIKDIEIEEAQHVDSKLIFIAQGMKAKLMTTDYNLAKQAEFSGIEWLNINALSKALNPEVTIGQYLDVDLVKPGKEPHQGVGYLPDGSMVVVNEAFEFIGQTVAAEVISVLPSAGGKMIFARLHSNTAEIAA